MFRVATTFILTLCLVVSVSCFLKFEEPKSFWISPENFTRIVNASFNSTVCCNVLVSGDSESLWELFKIFIRAYPYEYLVNRYEAACTGYMMFLNTTQALIDAMPNVVTSHSTVTMLIVIDERVENLNMTQLLNDSIYNRAQVNIVTGDEIWKLSENYHIDRHFHRVFNWKEMQHEWKLLNLDGRTLKAATDYNPPMSYLKTTHNKSIDGKMVQVFLKTNVGDTEFDGIEIRLFELIADRLNFTWEIRSRTGAHRYGRLNGSVWSGGIISQMITREVDVAFSGIWLELPQYAMINLSNPWTQLDVRFLVPRPKPYTSFWVLAKPLSPAVWAAIVGSIIVQTIFVYVKAWLSPQPPKRFRDLSVTLPEVTARLLGLSMSPHYRGFRLLFQSWHLIGMLIVTAYSSSLAASLASSDWEDRIDTTKQFILNNLVWGRDGVLPTFSSLKSSTDPWTKQFLSRFESEKNDEERHQKILKGNYAILGRFVGSLFFPENYVSEEDMKDYRMMKNPVGKFYSSFAVQPYLMHSWDKVLLLLIEAGFVQYHIRDVLHRHTNLAHLEVLIEYDSLISPPKVLKLTPLSAAFAIYALGNLLAFAAFLYETQSARRTRPVRQNIRNFNIFMTIFRIRGREFSTDRTIERIIRKLKF